MECHNCNLKQRQFYCDNCIRTQFVVFRNYLGILSKEPLSLRDFRLQIQHVSADRDEYVQKATAALGTVSCSRTRRAEVASRQDRIAEVQTALAKLRKENEKSTRLSARMEGSCINFVLWTARQRLRSMRENLATRRRTLSQANLLPPTPLDQIIIRETQQLAVRSETLAKARGGLVSELVEVFNIVEVGGRPPIGGKAGIKGEWTIGDLVLPVPGDIRRTPSLSFPYVIDSHENINMSGYPPDHINAVITHTIHFLGLLTFYLGIKLPFEITWTGGKLGVGQPFIRSIKGTESGSWAK